MYTKYDCKNLYNGAEVVYVHNELIRVNVITVVILQDCLYIWLIQSSPNSQVEAFINGDEQPLMGLDRFGVVHFDGWAQGHHSKEDDALHSRLITFIESGSIRWRTWATSHSRASSGPSSLPSFSGGIKLVVQTYIQVHVNLDNFYISPINGADLLLPK